MRQTTEDRIAAPSDPPHPAALTRSQRLSWGILWAGFVLVGVIALCGWLFVHARPSTGSAHAAVARRRAAPGRKPASRQRRWPAATEREEEAAPKASIPGVSFLSAMAALKARPLDRMHVELCATNLKLIDVALQDYYLAHDHRYPLHLSDLVPRYLTRIPKCRVARRDTYSASYRVDNDAEACTVYCAGKWHHRAGLTRDFPRLTRPGGLSIR